MTILAFLLWSIVKVVVVVVIFLMGVAYTVLLERKLVGRIQNRWGPNRVGPFGLLQPLVDGAKSFLKEDIIPTAVYKPLYLLAPVIALGCALISIGVVPFGSPDITIGGMHLFQIADVNIGLLVILGITSIGVYGIALAGWSSNNKYSLLGAMRAVAQMISYEIILLLSSVAVVMMVGSLSLVKIVEAQNHYSYGLPHWFIFTPWGMAGFVMYAIAATAETNRSPFDLPEGESELVAGYFTEYSGFKFAMFFMAEYLAMFSVSGLGTTLFLGGWTAPLAVLQWVPSWIWFLAKMMMSIFVFIWMRGTLPRLRQDQLMNFAWKFVLPFTLLNLLVTGMWRFMGEGWLRWVVCSGILLAAYVLMARVGMRRKHFGPRSYRYAE